MAFHISEMMWLEWHLLTVTLFSCLEGVTVSGDVCIILNVEEECSTMHEGRHKVFFNDQFFQTSPEILIICEIGSSWQGWPLMYRMTKRIIFVNCAILITFQAFIGGMRNLLSIDLIYNEYLLGEGSVSCGKHWASSCPGCAFLNGRPIIFAKNWCNGDCIWRNSGCHEKSGYN